MTAVELHVITPVVTKGLRKPEDLAYLTGASLKLSYSILEEGPSTIECPADEAAAIPGVVARAIQAEKSGAHGIVIDCFGAPGVQEARAAVSIPVFSPGETTMRQAAGYGQFVILTIGDGVKPIFNKIAKQTNTMEKLASIGVIDIPVLELDKCIDEVTRRLQQKALTAIKEEKAAAIILGCTGFIGLTEKIEQYLKDNGYVHVPVFDPLPCTIQFAAATINEDS